MSYNLVPDDESNTMPIFKLTITADIGGKKPYSPKTLSGDGAKGIIVGAGAKTTIWNAGKDCRSVDTDLITIDFKVEDITKDATYLCVDLSKYSFKFQGDPPDISKKPCKTKELWLRRIDPGTFIMGSPTNELGRSSGKKWIEYYDRDLDKWVETNIFYDSEVQHKVTLTKAFYIGIFEVTQAQFKKIARYNTSKFKGSTRPVERVSFRVLRGTNNGWSWPRTSEIDEEFVYRLVHHVVRYWDEDEWDTDEWDTEKYRNTFFYSLRKKAGGLLFDLPTEAQWEYACRADTTNSFNNGKDITDPLECNNLEELAWYSYNSFFKKGNETHTVGEKKPNALNLYDMHGNVSELCLDWNSDYDSESATDPVGALTGSGRVLRGGSFNDDAFKCRSAAREEQYQGDSGYDPNYLKGYDGHCGFRIVLNQ